MRLAREADELPDDAGLERLVDAVVERAEAQRKLEGSRVEMMRAYAETERCRSAVHARLLRRRGPRPVRDLRQLRGRRSRPTRRPTRSVPYAVQSTVRHAEFGLGTVTDVEDDRITVLFEDEGYRTLALDLIEERGLLEVT